MIFVPSTIMNSEFSSSDLKVVPLSVLEPLRTVPAQAMSDSSKTELIMSSMGVE